MATDTRIQDLDFDFKSNRKLMRENIVTHKSRINRLDDYWHYANNDITRILNTLPDMRDEIRSLNNKLTWLAVRTFIGLMWVSRPK